MEEKVVSILDALQDPSLFEQFQKLIHGGMDTVTDEYWWGNILYT